jgi:DNA-binding CsgD family transcriptional regulator
MAENELAGVGSTALLAQWTTPPMVGRRAELEQVERLLGDVADGRGAVLLVTGEPGIGKSRLIAEVLGRAERLPVSVHSGAADERTRLRPFGVIAGCLGVDLDAADPPRGSVARLLSADLAATDASPSTLAFSPWRQANPRSGMVAETSQLQFLVVEAITTLVEELCARGPVVVVVDDVQSADAGSLVALQRLAGEAGRLPLLLVCASRPPARDTEMSRFLDGLRTRGAYHLRLDGLAEEHVAEMVEHRTGATPGPALLEHLSRAGGNPFYVQELLRVLEGNSALRADPEHLEYSGMELPTSVRHALAQRLSVVARPTFELLQVASVLGSRFTAGELAAVLERPVSALAADLQDAIAVDLLAEHPGGLRFRHDLVQEAFYASLPDTVRRGLHLQAAGALEVGGRADRVADHLLRGASTGDAGAARWLHRAARQAGPRAPQISLQLLDRAIELSDPYDPFLDQLLADRVAILTWAGKSDEVERAARDLLSQVHDPAVEPVVRLCLAQSLLGRGRLTEALEELEGASRSPALSVVDRARFRAWAAKCLMLLGRVDDAAQTARLAIADAEQAGDDFARCLAGAVLGLMTNFAGDFRPALEQVEEAIAVADREGTGNAHRFPLNLYKAALMLDVDDIDGAQQAVERGRRLSEQLGTAWNLPMYHLISAVGLFWSGAWADAVSEFEAGRELADEIGGRIGMVAAFGLRSMIALHRGNLHEAEEMATAGERELAATGPQYRANWALWARALILERRGEVEAAYQVMDTAWQACAGYGIVAEFPLLGPDLVRMAMAAGQVSRAGEVEAAVGAHATRVDVPSVTAAARRCRALVTGRTEDYAAAATAYERCPRPLDRAVAWAEAGRYLGIAGHPDGRGRLEDALEIFDRLGAPTGAAQAEAGLRALGITRGRRGPRSRPSTGWDALTSTELKVAALVAEGLTNADIGARLFTSPRTARTHVSHALMKLGFRSRSELAAEVVRRQSPVPTDPKG